MYLTINFEFVRDVAILSQKFFVTSKRGLVLTLVLTSCQVNLIHNSSFPILLLLYNIILSYILFFNKIY
ncbi:hypothetical protein HOF65_03265 [bacterium]|nr:hypothetical protein [bacterium]MBT4633274.1 hypothetical protein [bacterium]